MLGGKAVPAPEPAAAVAAPEQAQPAARVSSPEVMQLLKQSEAAIGKGSYQEAIELSREVLKQEPENVFAWENLGVSYFAEGDYPKWVEAWEKTRSLEKDPKRWEAMNSYLNTLRRNFGAKAQQAEAKPKAAAAQPAAVKAAPEEIQRLYNLGIDFYTSGKLEKAKTAFEKILQQDPKNEQAAKALKRVNEDLKK
jgi:tetratricopeptide (TPR) repeat protein